VRTSTVIALDRPLPHRLLPLIKVSVAASAAVSPEGGVA
jgi:hypothetical protein